MGAVATSAGPALLHDPLAAERPAQRLFDPPRADGGGSLEEMILGVWEDLSRQGHAGCPVCGGRMNVGEACDGCGSTLS